MAESFLSLLNDLKQTPAKTALPLALLQEVGHFLVSHPLLERVVFYRASRGGMLIWHDTRDPNSEIFLTLSKYPQYERILAQGGIDYAHPLLVVGLQTTKVPFGLVEFEVKQRLSEEQKTELEWVTQALANLLDNAQLRQLLQKQAQASSNLNDAHNFGDIARVLGKYITEKGQFISINLFDFDEQGKALGIRSVATGSGSYAQSGDTHLELSQWFIDELMQAANIGDEILYADILVEPHLEDNLRIWLKSLKIRGIYAVNFRINNQVKGFIALNDTQRPLAIDDTEMIVFRSLVQQTGAIIANRQLLEASRQTVEQSVEQVRMLNIINELTIIANSQQGEVVLLDTAARLLHDATAVDHIGIVIGDDSRTKGTVISEYPKSGAVGIEVRPDDTLLLRMRESRDAVLIADVKSDPLLTPEIVQNLGSLGVQSLFVVPMITLDGEIIGSVSFDLYRPFTPIDEHIIIVAKTIVGQLALNVQKLRLFADAQRQAVQLQKINAFGQSVQATQDTATILGYAFDYLRQINDYDYAVVYVYDRNEKGLGMVGRNMYSDTTLFDTPQVVKIEQNTVLQQVWGDYESVQIDHLSDNTHWLHPMRGIIQSLVALPLMSSGRAFGVLEIGSYETFAYATQEMGILRQMANQLAVALDNADAYTRSQQQALVKTRANEISNRLQQQADVDSMVRVAVEEVGRIFKARRARLRLGMNAPEQEQ
jgi:GAF domain-containing protein